MQSGGIYQQSMKPANNLRNWPTTCGTVPQPVKLANSLWNWPTTCGTGQGQLPVNLVNKSTPVELKNILWNRSTTCGTGQRPAEVANNLRN
jgi:hypothetical protein